MKKEIVFIDEETLTKEELQDSERMENAAKRMNRYYELLGGQNGETKK